MVWSVEGIGNSGIEMPLYLVNGKQLISYPGLHVHEKLRICQDQSNLSLCRYPVRMVL